MPNTKTIVITGGSQGLGAAMVQDYLSRGMRVATCSRSKPSFAPSSSLFTSSADVGDPLAMQRFYDEVLQRFSHIDVWINNAGVLNPVAPIRDCKSEDVRQHLQTNLMGVFHGTQLFAKHVHEREGEGVLINISSGASSSAYEGWGAYCAGKAAVDRLTEVVQLEEASHGLHAYSVAPGIIDTNMQSLIRSCSATQFPMVDKFHELKKDNAFSSASFVAQELFSLAFEHEKRPSEVCIRLPSE